MLFSEQTFGKYLFILIPLSISIIKKYHVDCIKTLYS